jgi:hypothetical protein
MQEKGVDSGLSLTIRQPLDNYSAATQQLGSYPATRQLLRHGAEGSLMAEGRLIGE